MTPLINAIDKPTLEHLRDCLPQSLLISGKKGIGLLTIAHWLSSQHSIVLQPVTSKGDVSSSGTISIDAIRRLYQQTRAKSAKQIVIIDDAEQMSHAAQTAFLKLLEEPNSTTHFILTSHHPDMLLPTIRSRTQSIHLRGIDTTASQQLITQQGVNDPTKQRQILFLAKGLPAEIVRLTTDEAYFDERARIIADAKILATAPTYQKLQLIHRYRNDKEAALQLIDSALAIGEHSLAAKPQPAIVKQLAALIIARDHIATNFNVALQLTQAMV